MTSPTIQNQSDTDFTIDEPILRYHYHLKSIVYSEFTFGVVNSVGFDKYLVTRIHHFMKGDSKKKQKKKQLFRSILVVQASLAR